MSLLRHFAVAAFIAPDDFFIIIYIYLIKVGYEWDE